MITHYTQLKYPYPKSLSDFGITLQEYNSLRLSPTYKISADIWFGISYNQPVSTFAEIARIRNLSSVSIRTHIRTVMEIICDYTSNKKEKQMKRISDDINRISLRLFIENEMPYTSFQTYKDEYYTPFH